LGGNNGYLGISMGRTCYAFDESICGAITLGASGRMDHLFDGSLRAHSQLEDKDWDLEKQRDLINTNPLN
jgi:hypothetical protein